MNRNDFKTLARVRLKEARTLLKAGLYAGAYYLTGYVVECGLKACIAKKTKRFDFPPEKKAIEDVYTHSPTRLIVAAKLGKELDEEKAANPDFSKAWAVVANWSEVSRYGSRDETAARALFDAVTNPKYGVFRWIRKHW